MDEIKYTGTPMMSTPMMQTAMPASNPMQVEQVTTNVGKVVDEETLREMTRVLQKYKTGKASIEQRAIAAESWWKLRNQIQREKDSAKMSGFNAKSGWLHNVIVAKHADIMEAFPEPNILPREQGDVQEAKMLSKIVPVILEQNHFDDVYSDCTWQKLKTGTGIYKVYWDADKCYGLGDIAIDKVDVLNVFWEPGITDVQDSKYFFHTALMDNDTLEGIYPELVGKLKGNAFVPAKFLYDDNVSTDNKSTVIDCYYKKRINGKTELHYCKYVGNNILYSSENEGAPLYDHGLYPFVFDCMYPIEGAPTGYGFVDLCANGQEQIDVMQTAFIKNTMVGAVPRYFSRQDAGINEDELLDLDKPIVHINGNLGEDALRLVDYKPLSGNYIDMREATISELRETSGNTETSNGNIPSGVTAASAIAALQEASGKGSRDATRTTYRAYTKVIELSIELIRQFYTLPRQFRITGDMGVDQFVSYSNAGIAMQSIGMMGEQEMFRLPVFDIKVDPAKRTAYSRVTQNELALQFYQMGFFAPQQCDQALAALQMMDFDDRDKVAQMIARNGTMAQKLAMFQQLALALTQKYEPQNTQKLAEAMMGGQGQIPSGSKEDTEIKEGVEGEDARVTKARAKSRQATQVNG